MNVGVSLLVDKVKKFLVEQLSPEQIRYTSERFVSDFDLRNYAGLSRGLVLTKKNAANAITDYLKEEDRILDYVSHIIGMDGLGAGSSGRIHLKDLSPFLKDMVNLGWIYNQEYNRFEKNQARVKTRDWGILRNGMTYNLAFLNVDIVGSTTFSDHLELDILNDLYYEYRIFCENLIHRYSGRIWEWNGDGYMAVFYGKNECVNALRSGADLLKRVIYFQYRFARLLPETRIMLRMGADYGETKYNRDHPILGQIHPENSVRLQSDYCKPEQMVVSNVFFEKLPSDYQGLFSKSGEVLNDEPVFKLGCTEDSQEE